MKYYSIDKNMTEKKRKFSLYNHEENAYTIT